MTLERWDAKMWDKIHALYDRASPATRVVVAALLFVAFVALIAYVDVSAYLDKAAKARSESFGPTLILPPATRPAPAAPNPEPIPAPENLTPVPHAPELASPPPTPHVQQPGAGQSRIVSQQENKVRWIRGDRE